jgi:hypothetical protein
VLAAVVVASLAAAIVAWLVMPLSDRIPLAVGGYVATWFLAAGAVAAGCWLWRWRRTTGWPRVTVRSALGALAATALVTAVVVVPGSMSWTPFAVVGARAWLLPVIMLAVAVILLSIPLLAAPGFLILLLPLMVLFLVVLAGYAAVVSRFRDGYLAAVLVQAVPLALLVATTFPLVTPN